VEKRKKQHARTGHQGARVVDALAVTTVTGMVIATLAILIANNACCRKYYLQAGPLAAIWSSTSSGQDGAWQWLTRLCAVHPLLRD
jgi:hypothetical protein